ncbi:MAG: helix-turn-helix domain-containing protein [Paracoccaceae bacterium]
MPLPAGYHEQLTVARAERSAECFWSYFAADDGEHLILPDGRSDVIFRFRPDGRGGATSVMPIVTGPAMMPHRTLCRGGDAWVGVRMRPQRNAMLCDNGQNPAKNAVWRGRDAVDRVPRLGEIGAGTDDVGRLEQILRDIAASAAPAPHTGLERAVDLLHLSGGRMRMAALAARCALSARQLHRLFVANIGLAAKEFACLLRFHRALRLIAGAGLPPADVALEAGFADQAHMCRDFMRFGGFSPSRIPPGLTLPGILAPGLLADRVQFIQDRQTAAG